MIAEDGGESLLSAVETNFSAGNQPSEMSLLQSIIADFPLRETRVVAYILYNKVPTLVLLETFSFTQDQRNLHYY